MSNSFFYLSDDWDFGQPGGMVRHAKFSGDVQSASQNGGQLAGRRNRLINGGCRVNQRGSRAVPRGVITFGGADRWWNYVSGTTASAAANSVFMNAAPSALGYAHLLTNISTTGTGLVIIGQNLEAADVFDLSSQTVTASFWMYHDFGFTQDWTPELYTPNTLEVFNSVTSVAAGPAVAVPSGVWTKVVKSWAIGDVSKGLRFDISSGNIASALTNRSVYITNLQLEIGDKATPFEMQSVAQQLKDCRRYCQGDILVGAGGGATPTAVNRSFYCIVNFPVAFRTTPTLTLVGLIFNAGMSIVGWASVDTVRGRWAASNTVANDCYIEGYYIGEAELV